MRASKTPFRAGMKRTSFAMLLALAWPTIAPAEEPGAVASAMRTVFSTRGTPPYRTMGLTQRTFLDLVESGGPRLEVALVIDGTESMAPALGEIRATIQQMMNDLERHKPRGVAYQVVVYRDAGAESGEVSLPLATTGGAFTTDRAAVESCLEALRGESGAPYFPELIDEGLRVTLTDLPWTGIDDADQAGVQRCVLLFGDAPPFDPTLNEEESGARRRVATDVLVAAAEARGIRVSCFLCPAREADRRAQLAVLDQTRAFMSRLSGGTGGLMLDLSYAEVREAVVRAAVGEEVEHTPIAAITQEEVRQVRDQLFRPAAASDKPVVVAVLPHTPLEEMSFATGDAAGRLATELRMRLGAADGLAPVEPLLVERRFRQLARNPSYAGLQGVPLLQVLGRSVRADYVLWGEVSAAGAQARTRLYGVAGGEVVASAERALQSPDDTAQLASLLAGDLLAEPVERASHPVLAMRFAAARQTPATREVVTRSIASSAAHRDLVAGVGALERSLGYLVGDEDGTRLLADARQRLKRAAQADATNPLPHSYLASGLTNLARNASGDASTALMKRAGQALRAAYRFRAEAGDSSVRQEIEADYALLVRRRPAEAIPLYTALAERSPISAAARRANWMLAGIYAGDWGVDESVIDEPLSRDHLVKVLAGWPESAEALLIKRLLRWDESAGETRFGFLPNENDRLAAAVEPEA
ncbi:MAG: hypothetical protein AAGJ46_08860 [Planctomycetota bacterium]